MAAYSAQDRVCRPSSIEIMGKEMGDRTSDTCSLYVDMSLARQLAHSEKSTVVPVLAVTSLTDSSILVPSSSFSVGSTSQLENWKRSCCFAHGTKSWKTLSMLFMQHTRRQEATPLQKTCVAAHDDMHYVSDSCVLRTSNSCKTACYSCLAKLAGPVRMCLLQHSRGGPYP